MQNWIKCSERMPEDDGYVLAYRTDSCQVGELCYDKENGEFISFNFMGEHYLDKGIVTHWQPLPESPND